MAYCCSEATERHFDEVRARKELREYNQGTINAPTRLLLGALGRAGIEVESILDIGAGVGVVLHELMPNSTREAWLVEISSAYLTQAQGEAKRLGYQDRVHFVQGDIVEEEEAVATVDAVVLNRVLCCYPSVDELIGVAARKSGVLCALSYPRYRWYVRLANRWGNWRRHRRGDHFHTYIHPESRVKDLLYANGFTLQQRRGTLAWTVEVYVRYEPHPDSGTRQEMLEIRRATTQDAGAIASLYCETIRSINLRDYSPSQIEAWAGPKPDPEKWRGRMATRETFVACRQGHVVGFGEFEADGHVDTLFVHRRYQGEGIASRLLERMEQEAVRFGAGRLYTEASITARPFFERRGFAMVRPQEVECRGERLRNYVMEKELP